MFHVYGSRGPLWNRSVISLLSAVLAAATQVAFPADNPAPPDPDGPKYDLRYKLETGNVLRYAVRHRASIQSTIDQTTQAAQTKTDSIKVWKVTDVLPSGDIEIMNVVESVAMVNQLPDRDPIEYDSRRDETPPAGFEDAAKAIGVPLSVIRITPRGKIVRRDVKYRQAQAADDAPVVVRLPDAPVAVGATWDEPFEVRVEQQSGATKPIQTRRHHRLTGVAGNVATIEVAYQVLSPVGPQEEAQLIERMMSGEVTFDIAAGRVIGQQMEIDKRILGFAGPTSSMHYLMRLEEKLVDTPKVAARPDASKSAAVSTTPEGTRPTQSTNPPSAVGSAPTKSAAQAASAPRRQSGQVRSNRTATRPRSNSQPAKGYRR